MTVHEFLGGKKSVDIRDEACKDVLTVSTKASGRLCLHPHVEDITLSKEELIRFANILLDYIENDDLHD